MSEECRLCGGLGEVTITPYGASDEDADSFGCPCCITRERDEDEAKLKARIAELEQKLCDSLDAERAANVLVSKIERQQAVLVEALEEYLSKNDPEGFGCACTPEHKCGPCMAYDSQMPLRAALAAVKPARQEGSE